MLFGANRCKTLVVPIGKYGSRRHKQPSRVTTLTPPQAIISAHNKPVFRRVYAENELTVCGIAEILSLLFLLSALSRLEQDDSIFPLQ